MGTKSNPGKFDCYAKAADDEPIFVLRANDPLAEFAVLTWVAYASMEGIDPEKIAEAETCRTAMREWRKAKGL